MSDIFYGACFIVALILLGRLYLWWNYMFPQKGKIVSSGRQYRQRNTFLVLMGGIKLILILLVFLWLIGFFDKNETGRLEQAKVESQGIQAPYKSSVSKPDVQLKSELSRKQKDLRKTNQTKKSTIRDQIF